MKLTAQTTTKMPMAAAITGRPGGRPVDGAIFTESTQSFFPDGEFFDQVEPRLESDAGPRGNANRPLRRDGDFRSDDVFRPITLAGGHVARKRKIWQRGERNIVSAPDAGFEHASAPHRDAMLLAEVMDATRHGEAPDTTELDINDFASAKFHRRTGLLFGVDAFVKANRRFQSFLKFDVAVEIIPAERLLHHHQVKAIELLQEREVLERVRGIGIHHQLGSWKFLSQTLHLL